VLDQRDEDILGRFLAACVAQHDGQPGLEVQGHPDVFGVVPAGAVEAVERDDERYLPALEVVDGGEAVGQSPGIGEDHRAERPDGELIPHEPEPLLPGRAEEIEHQIAAQADPAEVHRDRGGGLPFHPGRAVGAQAALGEWLLGTQRPDLAHRTDQRGLAHAEPPRQQDLDGAVLGLATWALAGGIRVPVVH
jgi:hypothetical protein